MAIESFSINLTPNEHVYTTGDTIAGDVILVLNSQIKIHSLFLCFSGKGKVECVKGRTTFIGMETYYTDVVALLNEGKWTQTDVSKIFHQSLR